MTPAAFHSAYRGCADQVSAGTGIDPIALLAQWANETAWGAVVIGNNLGNIRCSPTTFCYYATLDDFAVACIATFHNGYYEPVLAATNATDQLAAIVASPWSAGHYGGSLDSFYQPLEEFELTPDEHNALFEVRDNIRLMYPELKGGPKTLTTELADISAQIAAIPGGGTEPPEPVEPKSITLNIPSVPGTATGTIS